MHKITIEKRSDDWMAYLDGDRRIWDCGRSPQSAIGNLVLSHQENMGIEVEGI